MPITGAKEPLLQLGGGFASLLTERLRLRPFTLEDAPSVQHFLGNEDLAKQTTSLPYPFVEGAAEDWLRSTFEELENGTGYTLAVDRREDGALLGAVGLMLDIEHPTRAELGYWVARTYWGNGIATEAVRRLVHYGRQELGIEETWARVFSENISSRRVLEKAGFLSTRTCDEDCPNRGGLRSITYYARG
jgi:[ribosomal protein S5]-alanine N-acetyltransferase